MSMLWPEVKVTGTPYLGAAAIVVESAAPLATFGIVVGVISVIPPSRSTERASGVARLFYNAFIVRVVSL